MKLQEAIDKCKHRTKHIPTIVDYVFFHVFEFFTSKDDVDKELKELSEEEKLYFRGKLEINF